MLRRVLPRKTSCHFAVFEILAPKLLSRGFHQTNGCFQKSWNLTKFTMLSVDQQENILPAAAKVARTTHDEASTKVTALMFAKLTANAFTPTRGSKYAAGYDLYSAYDYLIPAKGRVLAKTDIQISLPDECYGRVAPRSGLALKHGIDVGAGVIDQDYRGNVGVVLFNLGDNEFKIAKGDRIAQLICERIVYPELVECATLDETERGEGGFGSTGKN